MAGDLILRLAREDDLEHLRNLSAQARARYAGLPSLAHVADSPPLDRERFAACRVVVAVQGTVDGNAADGNDTPLGFVLTRPLDGLIYLDNISVMTGRSGRGIGQRLLADVIAQADAAGVPAIALTTFRAPSWNGPWFRRHGFEAMPAERIGPGLRGVMERQARTLDPATRETLWRPSAGRAASPTPAHRAGHAVEPDG